ncbi:hypothetical protein CEXT_361891 [Caerostris extrusa]|uniref:Uncharacterized protein n=1 Tax=Caerostris extrusa TaxID=172846 RepID=A0AAV4TY47_CAEEX|nr:hypothetical protein CEXT_361891 [Caerostris extrusa]
MTCFEKYSKRLYELLKLYTDDYRQPAAGREDIVPNPQEGGTSFAFKYRLGGGHRSRNVARSPRTALGEVLNGSTSYEQPSLVKKFAHLFQVLTVKTHCSSGQTGGPHIDFLASPKCGKQVIL